MKRVLLGLGSNKEFNGKSSLEVLSYACHDLAILLKNVIVSSVYRTKAMYVTNQDDFYNMVVMGYVPEDCNPFFLLKEIHKIEEKYGRNRDTEVRFGPRSLDIDIEVFGDEIINTSDLQIPHIRLKERAFVLLPMVEILSNCADDLLREKCLLFLKDLQEDVNAIEKVLPGEKIMTFTGDNNGTDNSK